METNEGQGKAPIQSRVGETRRPSRYSRQAFSAIANTKSSDSRVDVPTKASLQRSSLAKARMQLRAERLRGRLGHPSYDLKRHLALAQMVRNAMH